MNSIFYSFCVVLVCISFCTAEKKLERQLRSKTTCNNDSDCNKYGHASICIGNTVVDPGFCECYPEYLPQANDTYFACLPKINLITEPCIDDVQCEYTFGFNSACKNEKCVCNDGYHFWEKRCYESIGIGEICTFNSECILKDNKIASCISGICVCENTQHHVSTPEGDTCEYSIELGQVCSKNEQCITENSRCENVCKCKPGYTTSGDLQTCVQKAEKLGDFCTEDPQCEEVSNYTYCENYHCRCRNRHHVYLGNCYKNVKLNDTCTDDRECWIQPELNTTIHCKEGICSCTNMFTKDGRWCTNVGTKFNFNYFVILSVIIVNISQMFK